MEEEPELPIDAEPEPVEVATEPATSEMVRSAGKRRGRKSKDPTSHLKVKRGGKKKEAEGAGA